MRARTASTSMVIVGIAAIAAGLVTLVAGGDSTTAAEPGRPRSATSTTAEAASSTTTTAALAPTTTAPPETPAAFFAEWTAALAAGRSGFLVERLHPAVFERYDRGACEAYLTGRTAPAARSEVLAVAAPGPWVWSTDGLSRDIDGVTTVRVRRTEDGTTFTETETHVAVVDGRVLWFTDCGTPKEGGR